jgi:hypothetical protein
LNVGSLDPAQIAELLNKSREPTLHLGLGLGKRSQYGYAPHALYLLRTAVSDQVAADPAIILMKITPSHCPLHGTGLRRLTMMQLHQGFATDEMGFRGQFAQRNLEPPMRVGGPLCAKSGLMRCSKKGLFDHLVGGDL